ncbi:MAG: apolipoprotein N-acyltransferase [Pirellulales bacterium]
MARSKSRSATPTTAATAASPVAWWRSNWALAAIGNLLWWASVAPLSWSLLAWLAPVPWVLLIRQTSLSGRRPYLVLWLTNLVFWLATLYWLTLPHWATSFGWLALSAYLGLYLPLFVGLCRVAVHRFSIAPLVAAPIVWTGLELARAHLLSGFTMVSLATTQYRWPMVLQISDLFGSYGVSFLVMLVAAALAGMVPWDGKRRAWWPVLPAAVVLAATLAYGHWRLNQQTTRPGPRVALIQGSIDIDMKHDPTQSQRIFDEYFDLSQRAVQQRRDLDLVVWPETMFRYPWFTFDDGYVPPPDTITAAEAIDRSRRAVTNTVAPLGVPLLLGIDTVHGVADGGEPLRYNTALFLDPQGNVLGRYDKCHPVMFGEYVPFADVFPWIYKLTPLYAGVAAGPGPVSVNVGNVRYAADICYEDTVPHLIRSQVLQLRNEGAEPDVLVNLTNDGWFWGSSELDLHLACALFRSIECRKPLLIAANTGFSAWIDSAGRIVAQGPRRATGIIYADPALDDRQSWYLAYGDWAAGLCLLATCGIGLVALRNAWRDRSNRPSADA